MLFLNTPLQNAMIVARPSCISPGLHGGITRREGRYVGFQASNAFY
jgi:hypothetical protein